MRIEKDRPVPEALSGIKVVKGNGEALIVRNTVGGHPGHHSVDLGKGPIRRRFDSDRIAVCRGCLGDAVGERELRAAVCHVLCSRNRDAVCRGRVDLGHLHAQLSLRLVIVRSQIRALARGQFDRKAAAVIRPAAGFGIHQLKPVLIVHGTVGNLIVPRRCRGIAHRGAAVHRRCAVQNQRVHHHLVCVNKLNGAVAKVCPCKEINLLFRRSIKHHAVRRILPIHPYGIVLCSSVSTEGADIVGTAGQGIESVCRCGKEEFAGVILVHGCAVAQLNRREVRVASRRGKAQNRLALSDNIRVLKIPVFFVVGAVLENGFEIVGGAGDHVADPDVKVNFLAVIAGVHRHAAVCAAVGALCPGKIRSVADLDAVGIPAVGKLRCGADAERCSHIPVFIRFNSDKLDRVFFRGLTGNPVDRFAVAAADHDQFVRIKALQIVHRIFRRLDPDFSVSFIASAGEDQAGDRAGIHLHAENNFSLVIEAALDDGVAAEGIEPAAVFEGQARPFRHGEGIAVPDAVRVQRGVRREIQVSAQRDVCLQLKILAEASVVQNVMIIQIGENAVDVTLAAHAVTEDDARAVSQIQMRDDAAEVIAVISAAASAVQLDERTGGRHSQRAVLAEGKIAPDGEGSIHVAADNNNFAVHSKCSNGQRALKRKGRPIGDDQSDIVAIHAFCRRDRQIVPKRKGRIPSRYGGPQGAERPAFLSSGDLTLGDKLPLAVDRL